MRKLIALCGAPKSGKTTVQKYLNTVHGVVPVDDGYPLRDIAMKHFGLSHSDVTTQVGKGRMVTLPGGRVVQVRVILGEIGNAVEHLLGPDGIPEMALKRIEKVDAPAFSFGSTRRHQGVVYRKYGGIVVEIVRPGFGIVNEFDRYSDQPITHRIVNDGNEKQLIAKVQDTILPYLTETT